MNIDVTDLMDYTEWERGKWRELFRREPEALKISLGSHGDGRFQQVGDWVRHIFSAEKRYADRLSGKPLTDTASLTNHNAEMLFEFAEQGRKELRQLLGTFTEASWKAPLQFNLMNLVITASPKKIVTHVLVHEMRHWAQIATLLRQQGIRDDFHDLLLSPVMGGGMQRAS